MTAFISHRRPNLPFAYFFFTYDVYCPGYMERDRKGGRSIWRAMDMLFVDIPAGDGVRHGQLGSGLSTDLVDEAR